MSSPIMTHETIVFEEFQLASGRAIDSSKSLSDKPPKSQYEVTSVEHKKDPSFFPTYVPSGSISTAPSVYPGTFPSQKTISKSSLVPTLFNPMIPVKLLLTNV